MNKWRHKKRGSTYDEVGTARLQVADPAALRDTEEMIVYRGSDGQLWVRPALEFHDGRFEARHTVTIYVPNGYKDADEFLQDCEFEQADPLTTD